MTHCIDTTCVVVFYLHAAAMSRAAEWGETILRWGRFSPVCRGRLLSGARALGQFLRANPSSWEEIIVASCKAWSFVRAVDSTQVASDIEVNMEHSAKLGRDESFRIPCTDAITAARCFFVPSKNACCSVQRRWREEVLVHHGFFAFSGILWIVEAR